MSQLDTMSINFEILDHLPQGVIVLLHDGTVVFWNQCLEDWTGILKSTIVGTSIETHFPHLGTPKYTSRLQPLFAGGPPATFASQFHPQFLSSSLPCGQLRIQQTIAKAIWNAHTQEWQALIIIQDISDLHRQVSESHRLRKQAQTEVIERKRVETELADHNRSLALDAEIGRITNQSTNLDLLLQRCSQALVDHLEVAFARIWTLDSTQQFLNLQASAGLYTHLNGAHGHIPVGQFKIGQIAAEKKPHLTNAVIGDHRVSDQEWAKREGMVAFAGYPLLNDQEVFGVMAVFAKHPLTAVTLDILKIVGDRITTTIERQKFLQTHQELSLRYERILSSVAEGVFGLDLDGRTTFANTAAARMLGYDLKELVGIPMHATVHHTRSDGSPYPREFCPMYAAFKDGAIHNIENEVLWRKDGSSFPINYSSRPIHDEKNQIVGAVVTFKDITELKQMEKAQAYLQRAIDQGNEGVALLDQNGRYSYVNRAHASMYGYRVEELMGDSWKILYSKDQFEYITEHCFSQIRDSGKWEGELIGLRKDGTDFWVHISLSILLNTDESSAGLVCTCRDITERKDAEAVITQTTQALEQQNLELSTARDEALAAARSKSVFLATMSHEIRTPLNGVIGMTDLLFDTSLDEDQQEMVETVKHSGEFLLSIINDILDFSKIDAGKLDLEIIDFDIRKTVDEVLCILAEQASQKNLELIGLIYATTPLQLRGDPGRIRQIIYNLLGNAVKFTQDGEIVVDVSVSETSSNATTLRFAVTDTGIGITPAAQARLFEVFTQADSSTTRKFGGTGLGLAICKQLITLMHGEIGVISEKGHGSTFWFTIPLAHASASSTPQIPHTTLTNRRVCIVESNDTIRFVLQHYAQSWGMICEVAQNGNEGLALLQQRAKEAKPFDIAILDHTLSETIQEDGLSLAKRIRQDNGTSYLPLLLLTALGKRGDGKLAEHAGLNGYLTKPIRHQQLQKCLQMIIGKDQQPPPLDTSHSSTLITRHTVEEAQAQTDVRILLAEDNVVNQKVAVRMLQKIGHRVDVVQNGQEAFEAIERTPYDLILMDCQMPEMDGLQATKKIREAERGKEQGKELAVRSKEQDTGISETSDASRLTPQKDSRVPIIALTANALSGDRKDCLEVGMDDFLAKPVRIEELKKMILKWLPHRIASTSAGMLIATQDSKSLNPISPCLDETVLDNLKSLGDHEDPDFFITVVDQFLEDLPRHLKNIQQAIKQQDVASLIEAAHACKGSSRAIGAASLAEISYALESMGREGTIDTAAEKFERWLKEQDRTIHALEQERKQLSSSLQ